MLRAVAKCGDRTQEARVGLPVAMCRRFSTFKALIPRTWKTVIRLIAAIGLSPFVCRAGRDGHRFRTTHDYEIYHYA